MKRLVLAAAAALAACTQTASDAIPTITVTAGGFVRRVTATGNLKAVDATPITVPEIEGVWGPLTIAWIARDGVPVHAGDVVVRFDRVAAEKQLIEAEADLASADTRMHEDRVKAGASATEKDAAAASAARDADQAKKFQALDPRLYSRNDIIGSELDEKLAAARLAQAERARRTDRVVSRSNLELSAISRQRAVLARDHAKTALDHLEIHAPHDGLLVLTRDEHGELPKVGGRMWQSNPVGELPKLDEMQAELFVLEVDGSGLDVGQPADVIVDSHPDTVFHGTIKAVDKLAKPRDVWVPVQYFSVTVALDHTDAAVMKLGQRVHATLVLDRSAHAIAVPRQAVFERAGKPVVYKRDAHGFTAVPVELGAATAGLVSITAGLNEGDVIAEREPGAGGAL